MLHKISPAIKSRTSCVHEVVVCAGGSPAVCVCVCVCVCVAAVFVREALFTGAFFGPVCVLCNLAGPEILLKTEDTQDVLYPPPAYLLLGQNVQNGNNEGVVQRNKY